MISKSLFDDASQINKAQSPAPDIDFLNAFLPDPVNSQSETKAAKSNQQQPQSMSAEQNTSSGPMKPQVEAE